jgi:sortase A
LRVTAFVLLLVGSFFLADGCWIRTKAILAQSLLQHAWEETLATGQNTKAWPWADTWPVARLTVARLHIDQIILEGESGEVLAFGPGHLSASSKPGGNGHCILAGHRDTSFRFLRDLRKDDVLSLHTADGMIHNYRVNEMFTRQAEKLYLQQSNGAHLTLITCYPFNALQAGAELRYVVSADRWSG